MIVIAKIFLFVIIAAATSARHLTGVNRHFFQPLDPKYGASSHNDQIVQKHNINYNSQQNQRDQEDTNDIIYFESEYGIRSANMHHQRDQEDTNDIIHFESEYGVRRSANIHHQRDQEDTNDIIHFESEYGVRRSANIHHQRDQKDTNDIIHFESEYDVRRSPNIPKSVVDLNDTYTNQKSKQHYSSTKKPKMTKSSNSSLSTVALEGRTALTAEGCPMGMGKVLGICTEKH